MTRSFAYHPELRIVCFRVFPEPDDNEYTQPHSHTAIRHHGQWRPEHHSGGYNARSAYERSDRQHQCRGPYLPG